MFNGAKLLSATLGRVSPKYRTLGEWLQTYRQIIASRPISDKTKANRASALGHVERALGARPIGAIRPHEIAGMVQQLAATPQCAKRALFEARDVFNEAVSYGWIDRNPATSIKPPLVRIRLTLEQWRLIYQYATDHMPPWVPRMLLLALVTGQRRSDLCKMKFSDVWDGHLHIEQAKTGMRLALPLALRLMPSIPRWPICSMPVSITRRATNTSCARAPASRSSWPHSRPGSRRRERQSCRPLQRGCRARCTKSAPCPSASIASRASTP